MKNQQVNVDYWAMAKAMLTYGALTAMCWLMLRLFNMVFTLPRRLRAQQETIQNSLQELQRRFPDLNITEEDLINAEKELEEITKDYDEKKKADENKKNKENEPETEDSAEDKSNAVGKTEETPKLEETKKTL